LVNQVEFHFKKSVCDFESLIKSYRQSSKKGWEGTLSYIFKFPLWTLLITLFIQAQNHKDEHKEDLELKVKLISTFTLFFEKDVILLCLKWGLYYFFEYNFCFWLDYERLGFNKILIYISYIGCCTSNQNPNLRMLIPKQKIGFEFIF